MKIYKKIFLAFILPGISLLSIADVAYAASAPSTVKHFNTTVGKTIAISLTDPGDGGAIWKITYLPDKKIAQLIAKSTTPPATSNAGDFGQDNWTFKALKVGTTKLVLREYQPFNPTTTFGWYTATIVVAKAPKAVTPPQKTAGSVALRDNLRIADLKQIQTALELFYTDQNTYPKWTGLPLGSGMYSCLNASGFTKANCANPYMAVVPVDPLGGYFIYSKTSTSSYVVDATLEGSINNLKGKIYLTPSGLSTTVAPLAASSSSDFGVRRCCDPISGSCDILPDGSCGPVMY